MWGEALRSPALAERLGGALDEVRRALAGLVGAYQERGLLTSEVPAEHVARVVIGLVHGFMVQRAVLGDVDADVFRTGLQALLTRPAAPEYAARRKPATSRYQRPE